MSIQDDQRERIGLAWARHVHGDKNDGCEWCAEHALQVFDAIEDAIAQTRREFHVDWPGVMETP